MYCDIKKKLWLLNCIQRHHKLWFLLLNLSFDNECDRKLYTGYNESTGINLHYNVKSKWLNPVENNPNELKLKHHWGGDHFKGTCFDKEHYDEKQMEDPAMTLTFYLQI